MGTDPICFVGWENSVKWHFFLPVLVGAGVSICQYNKRGCPINYYLLVIKGERDADAGGGLQHEGGHHQATQQGGRDEVSSVTRVGFAKITQKMVFCFLI